LTAFFVLVVGPIAYWVLARAGSQGFGAGIEAVNQLPTGYLMLTIAIVASAEELLYRGYAIERLSDLTGSYVFASMVLRSRLRSRPRADVGLGARSYHDRLRRHSNRRVPMATGYPCGDPGPHRDRPLRDRPGAISNALHAKLTEVPWRLWVIRPPTAWSMTCPGASAALQKDAMSRDEGLP
jgi:hypothetical protein